MMILYGTCVQSTYDRSRDLSIFSATLSQLSYCGQCCNVILQYKNCNHVLFLTRKWNFLLYILYHFLHLDCNAMPMLRAISIHLLCPCITFIFLLHFVCNAMPMLREISIHLLCPCIQSRKAFGHSFPHFLIYFNKNQ